MQVTSLLCDHCSQELDLNNRVQMIIYTDEPIADPQIDLCSACAASVVNNATVKSAQSKAHDQMMESVRTRYPQPEVMNPELPPDDYEQQGGNPRS